MGAVTAPPQAVTATPQAVMATPQVAAPPSAITPQHALTAPLVKIAVGRTQRENMAQLENGTTLATILMTPLPVIATTLMMTIAGGRIQKVNMVTLMNGTGFVIEMMTMR